MNDGDLPEKALLTLREVRQAKSEIARPVAGHTEAEGTVQE